MAKRVNPGIVIDWDAGEGRLVLGQRLKDESPLFKVDVLGDIAKQAEAAYEAACEQFTPGLREQQQRQHNQQRRTKVQALVGRTIRKASPLRNGDIVLELDDGSNIVFCCATEDVWCKTAPSMEEAVAYAEQTCPGTWFIDEPKSAEKVQPQVVNI